MAAILPRPQCDKLSWWRHQMETSSALLALCAGNSPVTVEFPSQRPVTGGFDVFFDLCPNKRLSKQSCSWWFETPSRLSWSLYYIGKRTHLWPSFYPADLGLPSEVSRSRPSVYDLLWHPYLRNGLYRVPDWGGVSIVDQGIKHPVWLLRSLLLKSLSPICYKCIVSIRLNSAIRTFNPTVWFGRRLWLCP